QLPASTSEPLTASQTGATYSTPAPHVSQTYAIAHAGPTRPSADLANTTYGAPDFSVSATASSGLAVSFAASGNCTVGGAMVHLTGAGSWTITASQSGDAYYNLAPDVSQTLAIAKAGQAFTFGALAS